ncbi:MAG: metal ABC transporter substrate-binding protein [Candidatus Neomarinimicrobiota bacterium]
MKKILMILLSTLIYFACSEKKEEQSINESKIKSVTSVNYPLHFFVTQIGGSKVDALFPIPADVDPAYWEPAAEDIIIYQEADLILLNGAGYAKWVDKVSLPPSKMINTSLPFKDKYIELEEGQTHSHGPEGEHEHHGFAFTTWLNFKYAKIQAEEIKKALINLMPENRSVFEENYSNLAREIDDLDRQMNEMAISLKEQIILGSHPIYQYLSSGYGLNIESFHWEADEMPDEFMWENFDNRQSKLKANIMLWEDDPLPEIKQELLKRRIRIAVFKPCANTPTSSDFLNLMKTNIIDFAEL